MRHGLLLCCILTTAALLPGSGAADPGRLTPLPVARHARGGVDLSIALKVERQVRLPLRSLRLDRYARFYFRDKDTPPGMVSGWYVGADNPPNRAWPSAGIHLRRPDVSVTDGGCFVVRLTYDPARDVITEIRCNGDA